MPYISTEALVGGALLVVLALGYQYLPAVASAGSEAGPSSASSTKNNKKKNKKKAAGARSAGETSDSAPEKPSTATLPSAGPGKKGKQSDVARSAPTTGQPADNKAPIQPQASEAHESSAGHPSFAEVADPATSTSSSTSADKPKKPKTLAQKIAPQPRKTKVDDMLAPEDKPATHARVMKITKGAPSSGETSRSETPKPKAVAADPMPAPAAQQPEGISTSVSDDEDNDSSADTSATGGTVEDDGWNVVPVKSKKPMRLPTAGSSFSFSSAASSSNRFATDLTENKNAKKNAKKAEAKKAQKAAEEEDRLRRLAQHKRGLERERINELYASKKATGAGTATKLGGTSKASLDHNGKLIWD